MTRVDLMGYLPRDSAFPRFQHPEDVLISFERQLSDGTKSGGKWVVVSEATVIKILWTAAVQCGVTQCE